MIGIAFTGSGKTLAFCLPLIMLALEEEVRLPFVRGEGPVGVVLCPSRELATQTYENVLSWTAAISKDPKYPPLNTLLCIGGISMGDQGHVLNKGLHIVVATPGRLIDMLEKKRFGFANCKYLCMDEADRMIDLGFEDDVRNIMSFFKVWHSLVDPVTGFLNCMCSVSARHSSSLPRCRARFKTLRNNRSSDLSSSTSAVPALPTWTCCKSSNTSSRKQRWFTSSSVCKRRRRP